NHVSGFKQSILVVFSGRSFKGSLEEWLFKVASGDVPPAYLRIPPMRTQRFADLVEGSSSDMYHIITSFHVTV
ncbi:unnamed protein product, partial [Porites evermanni]